jgi:hypothetical protein
MKQYIYTFEHSKFGCVLMGAAFAYNELAGIVRCARQAGLIAKRIKGRWQFFLRNAFASDSVYILR